MPLNGVEVLETVLRDGAQSRDVHINSTGDALKIIKLIDSLKYADIIEAGFAGSSSMEDSIIRNAAQMDLNARVAAFGRTRAPYTPVDDFKKNPGIKSLLDVETPVVVLVYKSWDYQVPTVNATPEENMRMVEDTVKFFVHEGKEVIVDAEHASGAFLGKPQIGISPNLDYLLKTMEVAKQAGASKVVLCDTTGILLPQHVEPFVRSAVHTMGSPIYVGFHGHNDHGVGDANNYLAVMAGATHVQTSFLGHGERTGNVNASTMLGLLTSPYQENKLEIDLSRLKEVSEVVHLLLTGQNLPGNIPFIGKNAYTHKGGMHADGNGKLDGAYNGRTPEQFGNHETYPITLKSGTAHIAKILKRPKKDPFVRKAYDRAMELLQEGYQLDQYPEFSRLEIAKLREDYKPPFEILEGHLDEVSGRSGQINDNAEIKVLVDGKIYSSKAQGAGLVDATIKALENVLNQHYRLPEFQLKYHVVGASGAGSSQNVLVEAHIITNGDGIRAYTMPGIHSSVTQASIKAITTGIEYLIMESRKK